jgi:nitrous oxidase accessory protein
MDLPPPTRLPPSRWRIAILVCLLAAAAPARALPPLQLFVDLTPEGGELRPPPGSYAGPVVIRRPITVDGMGQVTVDGGGRGTVVTVEAAGSVLRGLHVTGSGDSHDGVDAGILVTADGVRIEDNVIDESLFGIHLRQANGNLIRGNRVASLPGNVNLRGDGLRLWYSHDNTVEGNTFAGVRDLMFANSTDNRIAGNTIQGSRTGMEFVFSPGNVIEGNTLSRNTTGIVVLYSNELAIRGNRLTHFRSVAGSALALKESAEVLIEDNEVLHCAIGIQANAPTDPENVYRLRRNRFAYNDIAMYFYGEKGGHLIHDNRFEQNLVQVAVSSTGSARANDWHGNLWDDYAGFDRDGDGTGDTPHEIHMYADRLWMDRPMTAFFRGSPALEAVDFIERLAPFSPPALILSDPAPRMR